jgi:hypothetical protein
MKTFRTLKERFMIDAKKIRKSGLDGKKIKLLKQLKSIQAELIAVDRDLKQYEEPIVTIKDLVQKHFPNVPEDCWQFISNETAVYVPKPGAAGVSFRYYPPSGKFSFTSTNNGTSMYDSVKSALQAVCKVSDERMQNFLSTVRELEAEQKTINALVKEYVA